jgi:pimeloyl-ACP methyl ester carboxylesterase
MQISRVLLLVFSLLASTLSIAQNPKPTNTNGGYVDVDGSRLFYQECGTGAEAVVLLHDGVVNSAVWDHVWPEFCKHFHSIRYDRRGYGKSPVTKKPYYEADDLAALLRDRKISKAAIVASSHGGQVAMEFALRYPDEVKQLVLVGPGVTGFPYSEHFIMRDRGLSQSSKVEELIDASVRDQYLIVAGHDAARKRLHDLLAASPQDLTHDDMPLPEKPIFPAVRQLRMPTLVLIGSGDIADNEAVAGALVVTIPNAQRIVVPDTGHLMYLEKPQEFFGLVNKFLTLHGW